MRSLSAYGRGLRFLEGLRDGQEHLVGQVREEVPHLHRLFGREVVLLGQPHRGGVQPLAEERERLHGVAKAEAVAGELAAVLVADLARFIDEVGAAGPPWHGLGGEGGGGGGGGAAPRPATRPRRSSSEKRRWPPGVRKERTCPASAQRRRVDSFTPSSLQAWPRVIQRVENDSELSRKRLTTGVNLSKTT